jgi:phosphate transport system protein
MARDLRFIMATQIIAIELERMGDYARGIAEIALRMGHAPPIKPVVDLPKMADLARDMLREVLDAFARRDVSLARAIPQRDDAVDALNDRIYSAVIDLMIQDPQTVNRATWLLWVTHNIERLADRVTNVAERVVFMVTGELTEMDVSSY